MATRFYLPSAGAPAVSPAFHARWTSTEDAVRRPLSATKTGTTLTYVDALKGAGTQKLHYQYVSAPLGSAATIQGNASMVLTAWESSVSLDAFLQASISVVSGDGTTVRGVAYPGQAAISPSATATDSNYEFDFITDVNLATTRTLLMPLTPVAAEAGDRIVVEIGYHHTYIGVLDRRAYLRVGDSPLDHTYSVGVANTRAPWVEFDQTLPGFSAYQAPPTSAVVGRVGAKALSVPGVVDRRVARSSVKALTLPSDRDRRLARVGLKVLRTPAVPTFLQPPAGTINLSASPPSVRMRFTPPAGVLTASAPVPSLRRAVTFAVPAGQINMACDAPTLDSKFVTVLNPPAGTITLSVDEPSLPGSLYAAPAGRITMRADAPTFIGQAPVLLTIPAPGVLTLTGLSPMKLILPGDGPSNALLLTGSGGVATMDLTVMGGSEMPVVYGVKQHIGWWRYTPTATGELDASITGPAGWSGVLEVYERDNDWTSDVPWDPNYLHYTLLGAAAPGGSVTIPTTAARLIFLRIHPFYTNDPVTNAEITWSHRDRLPVPSITVRATLKQAPGSVLISLSEVTPDATVTVSIIDPQVANNPVLVTETGQDGTSEFSLPVPSMKAGTYTIEITVGTTTLLGELVILSDPLDDTTPDDPDYPSNEDDYPHDDDNADDEGYNRNHPRHWKFKDPQTDKDFHFPHNPASWSGIERPNWFEYDATTAPDGQELVWQAAGRAEPFEFNGYLDSEDFYTELVFWSRLRRRFWLRDHRNRWWLIAIEQFDPTRRVVPNKPWAHDYTMRCVQFMGPMGDNRDAFDDEDDSYDDHHHSGHDEE